MSARKPKRQAAQLKRRLAKLLIEIDDIQTIACDDDSIAGSKEILDIINTTDVVAAELARVLLPPDQVAAELFAARAGIAVNAPGLWRALGEVAARFGDGAVNGRGIKVTDAAMAAPTLEIAFSTAAIDHPTGTCCEGHGTFLRIKPDGSTASWTEIAKSAMAAARSRS